MFLLTIILGLIFGASMKLADLVDEHGHSFFKRDKEILGLLWGAAGVGLVLVRADVANVIVAKILSYLFRLRLDFQNHALAATMIIIAFIARSHYEQSVFLSFFIPFLVFGVARDYIDDIRRKKDWLYRLNEPALYNVAAPLIYSGVTGNWLVSAAAISYIAGYDLVKASFKGF